MQQTVSDCESESVIVTVCPLLLQVQRGVCPAAVLQLHRDYEAVLGPLVTLGAVECHDVAVTLSALLQRDLDTLVCTSESASGRINTTLGRWVVVYGCNPLLCCRSRFQPGWVVHFRASVCVWDTKMADAHSKLHCHDNCPVNAQCVSPLVIGGSSASSSAGPHAYAASACISDVPLTQQPVLPSRVPRGMLTVLCRAVPYHAVPCCAVLLLQTRLVQFVSQYAVSEILRTFPGAAWPRGCMAGVTPAGAGASQQQHTPCLGQDHRLALL